MVHRHNGIEVRHAHSQDDSSQRLRLAFVLSAVILIVEIAGGLVSNSLAVLSDAGHVFTDVLALGLAWFAAAQALKPATPHRTFGFHRAGILAAFLNALALVGISLFITIEAIRRMQNPEPVDSGLMMGVAAIGLAVNVYVAVSLRGELRENLNIRSAMLHVIGDILASLAVIVGGVVIMATGWYFVDPLLSVLIAVIIVGSAWSIVLETVNILMEGTPRGVNFERLINDMRSTPGVLDAHDVHVWSIASGIHAMSGHVLVEDQALSESTQILQTLSRLLAEKYGIDHATIQFEHSECGQPCTLVSSQLAVR